MNSSELLRAGQLDAALAALHSEVRAKPEDDRLRICLFQLNCVLGRWGKALDQLQAMASLNADTMMLAHVFRPVIASELLRAEIFAGKRMPLIFGEPAEWMGWLLQAGQLTAQGKFAEAAELRGQALESAPASSGSINGEAFEWIADADSRLGPMLELVLEGKYYWVPFCRILKIELTPPTDLRDLVWLPAKFTWVNGGEVSAHIPARYPGTESVTEDALKLARKTIWQEHPADTFLGIGQRSLATNVSEYPLFSCKNIEFSSVSG